MRYITVFTVFSLPLTWASPTFSSRTFDCQSGGTVQTSSGPVSGHPATRFPEVSEYLGIPYAQAPVGELRFAAPVKYVGSSALNGTVFGFTCPRLPSPQQPPPSPELFAASNITEVGLKFFSLIGDAPGLIYNEDCLSLNVWSKPQSGERQKAVLVYIHGGGFTGGGSAVPIYNGATLADREDVIVVTLNYRVSILGFPGSPESQNNLAFLDQRLALEWVRDNIANFGGDPARITLFGQSAGAMSVDFLAYAYTSDPIVAGIISQSGTTFSAGLPIPREASAANWYTVTAAVGCGNSSNSSTEQLACMRNLDLNTILAAVPTSGLDSIISPFGPTVDNTLVFSNYSEQVPAHIPLLIGSDDYEAGTFRTQLALGNITFAESDWDEYNLASFTCPASKRANVSLAASNPTWRYRYHGVFPNVDISSQGGAYHGAELQLLFGTTYLTGNSTAEEIAVEAYIQGAWAAFAKDPARGLLTYEGGWPLYDPAEKSLVRLSFDNLVGTNLAFPDVYDAGCATASIAALLCRLFGVCQ